MIELLVGSALRALLLGLMASLALKAARTSNPHLEMTIWSGVLAAALVMPGLMQLSLWISLPVFPRQVSHFVMEQPLMSPSTAPSVSAANSDLLAWNWYAVATLFYSVITAAMLAKLILGLWASHRLVRKAARIEAPWTVGRDVRMSENVAVPVTIGRSILLPIDFCGWNAVTRQAVLSHEGAHAKRGDFHLLLLADLHRAVFWFSPLAWWLRTRLAQLSESTSDDAAIRELGNRPSYAEILMGFAGRTSRLRVGVEMARSGGVAGRVERILEETVLAVPPTPKLKIFTALGVLPIVLLVACLSVTAEAEPPKSDESSPTPAEVTKDQVALPAAPKVSMELVSDDGIIFSEDHRSITAHNHVKAVFPGKMTLTGDSIVADLIPGSGNNAGGRISRVRLSGNVKISSQSRSGHPARSLSGDQADYSLGSGIVTVSGKVTALQGGKHINGGYAKFNPDTDMVRVYPAAPQP